MSETTRRLKEKIVRDGLASVKATEHGPKLVGGIFGFQLAAALHTPVDFERVLYTREALRNRMLDDGSDESIYWYWVHVTATEQIRFVYQRMMVFWRFEFPPSEYPYYEILTTCHP